MNGITFVGNQIGYKDIPKIACTSLKKTIYESEKNEVFDINVVNKNIHDYFWQKKSDISKTEFKFIVIRDPVKRFLSAYSNRVGFHKECSHKYISSKHPELIEKVNNFDPSLDQFIRSFEVFNQVKTINWHTKPIVEHDVVDLGFFTMVYRIEELSVLEKDMSKITKKGFTLGREQTGGKKIALQELNREQLDFLIEYYKKDYELMRGFYSIDRLMYDWRLGL